MQATVFKFCLAAKTPSSDLVAGAGLNLNMNKIKIIFSVILAVHQD